MHVCFTFLEYEGEPMDATPVSVCDRSGTRLTSGGTKLKRKITSAMTG